MTKQKYDVFISYAYRDKADVEALKTELESAGIKVWDNRHFETGSDFLEDLRQAIELSRYVVLYISKNFLDSEWTNFEAGVAIGKATDSHNLTVLPVISPGVDYSQLPYMLRKFAAVSSQDTDKLISQVKAKVS